MPSAHRIITIVIPNAIAIVFRHKSADVDDRLIDPTRARHLRLQVHPKIVQFSVPFEPFDATVQRPIFSVLIFPNFPHVPTERNQIGPGHSVAGDAHPIIRHADLDHSEIVFAPGVLKSTKFQLIFLSFVIF